MFREDKGQILVVQDKYKVSMCSLVVLITGFSPQFVHWKFPGGLAEPTEDIGIVLYMHTILLVCCV